jgi:hypothetical protein
MSAKITNIISEILKINGATLIPKDEKKNFSPPRLSHLDEDYIGRISARKIWNGGSNERNIDEIPEKINKNSVDKISPIANEINILADIKENDSEELWGSSSQVGTEAIAWYKSFHTSKYWGIYVSYSGLLRYAKKFYSTVGDDQISIDLAWNGIMAHESTHYAVDVACSKVEIIANSPIYLPGKKNAKSNYGYSIDEERLAEGALLRYFKSKKNLQNSHQKNLKGDSVYDIALRNSMKMPKGYCEGYQASTMMKFKHYADKYIAEMVSFSMSKSNSMVFSNLELANLMPLKNIRGNYSLGYTDYSECPIYIVNDHSYSGLPGGLVSFLSFIDGIQESQKFIKKISPRFIDSWNITKMKLSDPIVNKNSSNLDFKRWHQEDNKSSKTKAWTVRVGGRSANMRAHIDEHIETGLWIADRFGNADEMGHHKNR